MQQKGNPIPKQGYRKIYCTFYNDCLDHAVKCSWKTWNCAQCPHRLIEESTMEREYELNNTDPCYDLPPDVGQVVWQDAFGQK